MAKFITTRVASRFPTIWEDPDTTKNRIFINNYGYDKTTLSPRPAEIWYWQTRINTFNTSTDFDNYGPIQLSEEGVDGVAFSASQNDVYYMPGLFNTWQCSLDHQDLIPTNIWRSTVRGGRTIASYPRSITTNETTGDHWCGEDMNQRSQSWRTADTLVNCHLFERTDQLNFNALSWSFSGTTITVNWNAHGLMPGDTVTVSGATATTNAPNGTWIVYTVATNSFTFIAPVAPTGTAGGTMNVIAECRSAFGFETENGTPMMRLNVLKGYAYTYEDNSTTAGISRPTYTTLNSSDWKFYMGRDDYFMYVLQMAGATTNAYSVNRYYIPRGAGAATTIISAQTPTNAATAIIPAFPSNIRHDSSTRKVFYSGHFNGTSLALAPMRLVWTKGTTEISFTPTNVTFSTTTITVTKSNHGFKVGDVISVTGLTATTNAPNGNYFAIATVADVNTFTYTALATPTGTIGFASSTISGVTTTEAIPIVKTDCTLNYPGASTFTTYSAIPTASSWNANGINNWWCQPYQFTSNGNNYVTFTVTDSFYYSSTTRFPSLKSRTWMTYQIGSGTGDDTLTFHSAINFPLAIDFPLSWSPYGANTNYQDKVILYGVTGTSFLKFEDTTFDADSWSYVADIDGINTATITVTKTAHGLNVGDSITTSGATASSNAPNGVYKVFSATANTFKFITDSNMSSTPTGSAGGTMNVRLGWQTQYRNNIRTRGYGIDSLDRVWLTSRNSTVGRVTVHLISGSMPSSVNIRLQDYDDTGTDATKYVYSGTNISTNLLVDVYNNLNERIATELTLTINGDTMRFATGDYYTKTINTSSSATTNVAVVITGPGKNSVTVANII